MMMLKRAICEFFWCVDLLWYVNGKKIGFLQGFGGLPILVVGLNAQ